MLRAFGHPVAMCFDMLGIVDLNLTSFKLEPTTPNMSQHIATRWPNARNMLRPTMLRHVLLACCDRLAGALGQVKKKKRHVSRPDFYKKESGRAVFFFIYYFLLHAFFTFPQRLPRDTLELLGQILIQQNIRY